MMDHFIALTKPGAFSARSGSKKCLIWFFTALLALTSLACGIADQSSGRIVIRGTLPTLTPTPNQIIAQRSPDQPAILAASTSMPATNPTTLATGIVPTPAGVNVIAHDTALAPAIPSPDLSNKGAVTSASTPFNNSSIPATPVIVQPAGSVTPASGSTPLPATPGPTPLSTMIPGEPTPTLTPVAPTPTTTTLPPLAGALAFANVRTFQAVDGTGLLLYGDVVNQSDSAQEIKLVTGQFLDAQGQVIADESRVSGYWPVEIVPAKEKVPFELFAEGIQSAADFKIRFDAQPSGSVPRRDFVVSTAYQENDEFGLCLGGTLQNPGAEIQDYLVVAAVLYDVENKLISFGDTSFSPAMTTAGQSEEFEICADSFGQNIGRYELQAWGE